MQETKQEWLSRLEDMHGLDEEDILDISEVCVDDTGSNIDMLKAQTPNDSNREELCRLVHSMKGASANLGLDDFAQTAKVLEAQLRAGDDSQYAEGVAALAQHFEHFCEFLKS